MSLDRSAAGSPSALRSVPIWAYCLLAVGGGVLWGLQFGRTGNLITPWWALAPFLWLLSSSKPIRLGYLHGIATWVTAMSWIAPTLREYGQLHPAVAWLGLLILGLILGSYHALAAGLAAPVWRRGGLWAMVGPAAIWVGCEWLRTFLITGFPWNLTGYAWVEVPGALPASSWIGSYGLSFLVFFASAGVALAATRRRWEPLAVGLLLPLTLLAMAGRWARGPEVPSTAGSASPVRLIQPNIPNRVPFDMAATQEDYRRLIEISQRACDQEGALLIWPESAAFPFRLDRDPLLQRDVARLQEAGCSLLINNAFQESEQEWFNSALLLEPGHEPARYDKLHLVPFGEYVPLRGILPFFDSLTRNAGDFSAAEELRLLPWNEEQLGVSICYEIVFPGEVAERVRKGATLLVTITNDAWYGDTFAPWQHFRAARFRAAENRRPVLRAAITGVTGVIGPDGSIGAKTQINDTTTLSTMIQGRTDLSPYTRAPWLVPLLSSLLGGAAVFRSRRAP